ncbi:CPBP family intramembrane metalloprotease [Herbiconiux sp.]|uniref:CPBP family intramembrane glutamic endopeptidase n=1 Tax=Herbiconiux sp. TaxID=1871186 RepID=UPI0025C09CE0|nr:CPBP family intramembrane metalloprotease [Herbiconiux sp.]
MTDHSSTSGWKRFWERGGWWKALILAAVYYGVYQLVGLLVDAVIPDDTAVRGAEGSATDVFFDVALPIVLTSILLVLFALSIGWLRELFAPQTVRGRGWMWVGIAVVLAINVSSLLSLDYAKAGAAVVLSWLFTGLFVGFAEEIVTRGFVVNLMRKAGHPEYAVGLVSAGVFAALHFGNVFTSDQGLGVTLLQVVYTFFFGLIMYLALRVTGNLIWPILLHASTDPSIFLHGEFPTSNPLSLVTAFSSYLVIGTGIVLLIVFLVSERRRARASGLGRPVLA